MNLTNVTATQAKNRFGEMINIAQKQPVGIQKNGQYVAILISYDKYQEEQHDNNIENFFNLCKESRKEARKNGLTKKKFEELMSS